MTSLVEDLRCGGSRNSSSASKRSVFRSRKHILGDTLSFTNVRAYMYGYYGTGAIVIINGPGTMILIVIVMYSHVAPSTIQSIPK